MTEQTHTTTTLPGGTFQLGDLTVTRVGYGAMQLAGPGVFGPPADPDGALAVLREVLALGITHIDTADIYGPYVTNRLIREALHIMSGNLSHQIEHHLFPDLPSNRYAEIAPRVKALFEKYDLNYHEAPLPKQVYSAWHKVVRLSLPNGWLATTNAKNAPQQLAMLYKMSTGGPKVRRAAQARLNQLARKAASGVSA